MRRRICSAILCSFFMIAALCSCSGKDNSSPEASAKNTEAVTEAEGSADGSDNSAVTGLAASARVTYNGVTFGTGDKASDIVASLGDQARPSDTSKPCIPDAGEMTNYYFAGMIISASQYDVITNISFTKDYGDGTEAKTVDGIGLGSTADEIKAALGNPDYEDEYGISYNADKLSLSIVFDDDKTAMSITIEDMSIKL